MLAELAGGTWPTGIGRFQNADKNAEVPGPDISGGGVVVDVVVGATVVVVVGATEVVVVGGTVVVVVGGIVVVVVGGTVVAVGAVVVVGGGAAPQLTLAISGDCLNHVSREVPQETTATWLEPRR